MDLRYSEKEEKFRAECRAFLGPNVPRGLPPLDSAEGFPLHVEWEKKLYAEQLAFVARAARDGRILGQQAFDD